MEDTFITLEKNKIIENILLKLLKKLLYIKYNNTII